MTDVWTDDEIVGMFADANPIPPSSRVDGGVDVDRAFEAGEDGVVFDLGDRAFAPDGPEHRERWWLVVGVAAAVALIVSLIVTTTVDDEPIPADEPTTIPSAPPVDDDPEVESSEIAPGRTAAIDGFLAAISDHDVDAALELATSSAELGVAPGAIKPGQPIADLADQFAWMDAFNWRWEDADCAPDPNGGVDCDIQIANRLTEFSGVEQPAWVSFEFDGDQIATVLHGTYASSYGALALDPYADWMEEHHPEDVTTLWSSQGPHLSAETAALMDTRLTEYISSNSDDPRVRMAYEFIAAVNAGDADAARSVLAPDHELRLGPYEGETVDEPTVEDWFAWLRAFGTVWGQPDCSSGVTCRLEVRNRLGDAQSAEELRATASFRFQGSELEAVSIVRRYPPMEYDAFIYWVNARNPEVAHQIWLDGDEDEYITTASAGLLDEQLTAYLASDAVGLVQDESAARALVDALRDRDTGALDDAVTADVTELDGWDRSSWTEMFAWMDANQEEWRLKACHPVGVDQHGCEIDVVDALTGVSDTEGLQRHMFALIEVDAGRISDIAVWSQSDDYAEQALGPFIDWLQANHPDEFDEAWTTVDGAWIPRPTARAAELHARHIAEYTASDEGS